MKKSTKENELVSNFFSDMPTEFPVETDDCTFYERNTSLVYSERDLFTDNKPRVSIQELFKGSFDELQQKFTSNNYSIPFLVKTYAPIENILLINKHVEIIGFLNLPKEYISPEKMDQEAQYQDELDHTLHPFFTPVLHALTVKEVPVFDQIPKSFLEYKISNSVRNKIIGLVKQASRGDMVFGRLLLYSIASLVTNRPFNTPIDIISMNLYGVNPAHVASMTQLIKILSPFPLFQSITLQDMSKSRFYGKKNYDFNCIEQGLPLEDGTTLVLDETQLEIGTLHEVAVKNATMLSNIVGLQRRYFDFDYCPFEADCNCTVISMSKGRSIFEFDNRVRFL